MILCLCMNEESQTQQAGAAFQPQVPVPIGAVRKEQAPVLQGAVTSEVVSRSLETVEPKIPSEVREAGVQPVSEHLQFTPEHQQIGIKPGMDSTVAQTQPTGSVRLPETEEELEQLKKRARQLSWSDSLRGMINLLMKVFKQKQRQ